MGHRSSIIIVHLLTTAVDVLAVGWSPLDSSRAVEVAVAVLQVLLTLAHLVAPATTRLRLIEIALSVASVVTATLTVIGWCPWWAPLVEVVSVAADLTLLAALVRSRSREQDVE